ncbi:MAG: hypothetical protein J7L69_12165 [Desulfobulbaceae bacterium]|nr:hypothetical protein [Desulfobulbaceae bacterium]
MRLFYFGKGTSETSPLLRQIESIYYHNLEIFPTVDVLMKRLRQIEAKPELLVLAPSTAEELYELVDRKKLFHGHPIILILPESDKSTIHNGHLLMPRFVTFSDGNLTEVKDVLEKMDSSRVTKLKNKIRI